jgi:hypothetical protein
VSDTQEPQAEPLTLEETARAAAELATRAEPARLAAGFLELVQRWAAPSAVLTAVRDPAGVAGFRLVPSLCSGSISLGIEKVLAKLVEETPQCLARPTLVRGEEMPGVRVRDNVVVPWWCEADSGLLVLRGVPRPVRPGLGEALALSASVVWPRLMGTPASRVETLVEELKAAAAKLESESGRQLERLKAALPAPLPAAEGTEAPRIAGLEEEIAKQRQQREAQSRVLEQTSTKLREREAQAHELEETLAALRQVRESQARELEAASAKLRERETQARGLEEEVAKLRQHGESQPRELDDAIATLRKEGEARARELEAARREKETASLDLAAAKQQSENAKRELAAAIEERRTAERDLDVARRELAARMAAPAPAPEPPAAPSGARLAAAGDRAGEALKLAIASVRRAAFVPPMLRVSMEEVAQLAAPAPRPARRHGIALLDRDVVALESVAAELEQAGIEVRLANQPEEMALLLRVDASSIDAVVCDVMSFRPDQNVAGLLRAWDKDRPGLAFFLSYDAQSPVELERARRTPMSLTAGHIQRPLSGARLTETLDNLAAKRQTKTS